jgi:hypothetical protein
MRVDAPGLAKAPAPDAPGLAKAPAGDPPSARSGDRNAEPPPTRRVPQSGVRE